MLKISCGGQIQGLPPSLLCVQQLSCRKSPAYRLPSEPGSSLAEQLQWCENTDLAEPMTVKAVCRQLHLSLRNVVAAGMAIFEQLVSLCKLPGERVKPGFYSGELT